MKIDLCKIYPHNVHIKKEIGSCDLVNQSMSQNFCLFIIYCHRQSRNMIGLTTDVCKKENLRNECVLVFSVVKSVVFFYASMHIAMFFHFVKMYCSFNIILM